MSTQPEVEPVLRLDALTVRYGKTLAVDNVSFQVPRGSVYALLGRNGAGKSSLVRCILGQQKPHRGKAWLLGEDVWKKRARLMTRVGVVPEDPDAPPEMTVPAIGRFCSHLYPNWNAASFDARIKRFSIPTKVPFGRLSKGERGLVMLALALAPSPELLILDDPTLGFDVVARRALLEELVGELADRGVTVFLTTHDLAGIEGIADRVGILQEGKVVLDEEMESLKARFRRVLEPAAAAGAWGPGAVVQDFNPSSPPPVAGEFSGMSLEEIFIALVGEERSGS